MRKMRFIAEIHGEQRVIDVDNLGNDDGFYTMTMGEKTYEVDAQLMRSHIVSMLINHRSYDVDLEKVGDLSDTLDGRLAARVRGRVVNFEMLDERRAKMKEAASAHLGTSGMVQINSPMPGKVLKILVSEGQEVEEGQGVVVVEAMKMENELKTPRAGVVTSVTAQEGAAVTAGAPLVLIE